MKRIINSEGGFTIIEILAAASMFALLGMGMVRGMLTMYEMRGRNYHNSLASQLAIEGIEDFQSQDPAVLTSANNSTTNVDRNGITFQREVSIVVEADSSRTITVEVTCPACRFEGSADVTNNFPLWGSV